MQALDLNRLPEYHSCGFRTFLPGERHINRTFSQDVLLLVFRGALRFVEAEQPVELYGGEWYIQRAGLSQTGSIPSDEPYYFYIHFNGSYSSQLNSTLPIRGHYSTEKGLAFARSMSMLELRPQATDIDRYALFFGLLSDMMVWHTQNPTGAISPSTIAYIAERFDRPLSIREMAKMSNYSENHFLRLFSAQYGISPHQYIVKLRMQKARSLLSTSMYTLNEISSLCGYTNYSSFYRAFCLQTGMSPTSWRKSAF